MQFVQTTVMGLKASLLQYTAADLKRNLSQLLVLEERRQKKRMLQLMKSFLPYNIRQGGDSNILLGFLLLSLLRFLINMIIVFVIKGLTVKELKCLLNQIISS